MESTPVGRGRGLPRFTPVPLPGIGRGALLFSPVASTPKPSYGLTQPGINSFVNQNCNGCPDAKRNEGVNEKLVTDIASHIGLSIGESIASCIESRLSTAPSAVGASVNDPSLLNVIVRQDVKEPVSFKGDGNDTCSVQEWEVIMLSYMKKRGIPVSDQADEVLSKLTGRAREVVKVGIRSKRMLTLTDGPEPIFEILKQHFSDTLTSSLPLADFYATKPHSGELPLDYWLRLNRALEVTEDSLKRQNKTFDYLSRDLATMFIQNCPDTELSLIFKCRPLQEWTVADIHDKLVEHCRDHKQAPKQKINTVLCSQRQEVAAPVQSATNAKPSQAAVVAPPSAQQAEGSPDRLDRVLALLERVLAQQSQQPKYVSKYTARGQPSKVKPLAPCAVCSDNGHTTQYHCRSDRLCFTCFAPDHTRAECPNAVSKPGVKSTVQRQEN